jgi:hypothetical protein
MTSDDIFLLIKNKCSISTHIEFFRISSLLLAYSDEVDINMVGVITFATNLDFIRVQIVINHFCNDKRTKTKILNIIIRKILAVKDKHIRMSVS